MGSAGWSYDADASAHAGRGGAGRGGSGASNGSSQTGPRPSAETTTDDVSRAMPGSDVAGAGGSASADGDGGASGVSGADGVEMGGAATRANGGASARGGSSSGGRGALGSGAAGHAGATTGAAGSHAGTSPGGGHGGAVSSGGRAAAGGSGGSTSGGAGGRTDATTGGSGADAGRAGSGGVAESALWFSEYVEGSSKYKALEIRGPAGTSLSGCRIETYRDGSLSPNTLTLDALVTDTETYVLCSSSLADLASVHCDRSTNLLFNGNDAVALVCNDALLDVIGQIGVDPGDAWTDGDASTANRTLRRRCGVTSGDSDGSDVFDPVDQWVALPVDSVDGLGDGTCG